VAHDLASDSGERTRFDGAVYDLTARTWSAITCAGAPRIDTRYADAIGTGHALLLWNGHEGAVFEP
jgi:hypothetical protein